MKLKIVVGQLIVITSSFIGLISPVSAAYNKFNCSDLSTACKGVTITSPQKGTVQSYGMYIPSGSNVLYQGWTEKNSKFNISFWIVDNNGKTVSKVLSVAQSGGSNYKYWRPSKTGTYFIRIRCGDTSNGRCNATVQFEYDI